MNFTLSRSDLSVWVLQVRDYIHVQDLATGHSAALHKLFTTPDIGTVYLFFNNCHMSTVNVLVFRCTRLHLTMICGHAGCTAYNLGTGKGTSVLEIVAAFEKAAGLVKFFDLILEFLYDTAENSQYPQHYYFDWIVTNQSLTG